MRATGSFRPNSSLHSDLVMFTWRILLIPLILFGATKCATWDPSFCPASGYYDCIQHGKTDSPDLSDQSVVVSNCVFSGCPFINIVQNVNLTFSNCTLTNWDSTAQNGLIVVNDGNSNVYIYNSNFTNGLGTLLNSFSTGNLYMENVNLVNINTSSPVTYGTAIGTNGGISTLINVNSYNVTLMQYDCAFALFYNTAVSILGGSCVDTFAYTGACLVIIGGTASVVNFKVINSWSYSADPGSVYGPILIEKGTAYVSNLEVINSYSHSNGVVAFKLMTSIELDNVVFVNSSAKFGGSLFIASSVVTMNNISIINTQSDDYGGAIYCSSSQVTINGMNVFNSASSSGGAFYSSACTIACSECNVTESSALINGGIGYFDGASSVFFNESCFTLASAGSECDMVDCWNSAAGMFLNGGSLTLQNTVMTNCSYVGTGASGGVGAISSSSGQVILENVVIHNVNGYEYGAILISTSQLSASFLNMSNCNSQGVGGGITAQSASSVSLSGYNYFIGNSATDGGAIYLLDYSTISVMDQLTLANNYASDCGGALYLNTKSNSKIYGTLVSFGNVASFQQSSLACIQSTTANGKLLFDIGANVADAKGMFFVSDPVCAAGYTVIPDGLMFGGLPSKMTSNPTTLGSIVIGNTVPRIDIQISDYFSNLNPLIQNEKVILELIEIEQNVTLQGNTIRLINFPAKNTISFTEIQIVDPVPGMYTFAISPLAHISLLPNYAPLTLSLNVTECTQYWDPTSNTCIPYLKTNTTVLWSVIYLSIFFFLLVCPLTPFVYKYRAVSIIKSNSFWFLLLVAIGSATSILSVTAFAIGQQNGCIASVWFENIGFFIVIGSLILKTNRIRMIFNSKQIHKGRALQDSVLLRYLAILMFVVMTYLIVWTVLSPPTPKPTLVYNSYMTIDRCSFSDFSLIISLVKLFFVLLVSIAAFTIRDIPSSFNESKAIAFCAYNWVIFGTLISLLSDFSIVDPTVAFIVHACSILIPNILTLSNLIGYKIYKCMNQTGDQSQSQSKVDSRSASVQNDGGQSKNEISKFVMAKVTKGGIKN